MWIRNTNTATNRLRDPDVVALLADVDLEEVEASSPSALFDGDDVDADDATVEFNDDGKARVTQDVGALLADKYDCIELVDRENDTTDTDA